MLGAGHPVTLDARASLAQAYRAAGQPQQAQQKTAAQPSDTVTLKSTGDVNHDGDSK